MRSSRGRNRRLRRSPLISTPNLNQSGKGPIDVDEVSRAIGAIDQIARGAAAGLFAQTSEVELDLAAGTNNVSHALGRTPRGVFPTFQSTAVDVTYDWRQLGNPHPDRVAVIVAGGVARARLVFF